jgi:hypothetical protein
VIVLVLVVVVVLGIAATYVVEVRRRRTNRRLAERAHGVQAPRADGIDSPTAAEGLLRGGYPPADGGGWGQ